MAVDWLTPLLLGATNVGAGWLEYEKEARKRKEWDDELAWRKTQEKSRTDEEALRTAISLMQYGELERRGYDTTRLKQQATDADAVRQLQLANEQRTSAEAEFAPLWERYGTGSLHADEVTRDLFERFRTRQRVAPGMTFEQFMKDVRGRALDAVAARAAAKSWSPPEALRYFQEQGFDPGMPLVSVDTTRLPPQNEIKRLPPGIIASRMYKDPKSDKLGVEYDTRNVHPLAGVTEGVTVGGKLVYLPPKEAAKLRHELSTEEMKRDFQRQLFEEKVAAQQARAETARGQLGVAADRLVLLRDQARLDELSSTNNRLYKLVEAADKEAANLVAGIATTAKALAALEETADPNLTTFAALKTQLAALEARIPTANARVAEAWREYLNFNKRGKTSPPASGSLEEMLRKTGGRTGLFGTP